jgi:hypothetical protein
MASTASDLRIHHLPLIGGGSIVAPILIGTGRQRRRNRRLRWRVRSSKLALRGGPVMTGSIPSRAGPALALAGAAMLAVGCGGMHSDRADAAAGSSTRGAPPRPTGAVRLGAAAAAGGAVARCQVMPGREPDADRPAGSPTFPGHVRLTRTATVNFGAPAGTAVWQAADVPCSAPGPHAGVGLCPPGFWRVYRLSISAGHHPPALFPFASGCGIAGAARPTPGPSATPAPLTSRADPGGRSGAAQASAGTQQAPHPR